MKRLKYLTIVFLVFFIFAQTEIFCQATETSEVITKALKDELTRNLNELSLEGLQKPFFISCTILDAKYLAIKATLGSIVLSNEKPFRDSDVRLMVGNYKLNDENFFDPGSLGGSSYMRSAGRIPMEDDYFAMRRALWITIDDTYKNAAEKYERKISALNQQQLSDDKKDLEDYCEAPIVQHKVPERIISFDKTKWEKVAKELSSVFVDFPEIFSSEVAIYIYKGMAYFSNTEGTQAIYPITIAGLQANAFSQADDGAPLFDHVLYYGLTPEELPSMDDMKKDIKAMADNIIALKNAPAFEESYNGPVLFEGQAVAEAFSQRLFSGSNGIIAVREPIYSDPKMLMFASNITGKSLEDRIDKRIFAKEFTVKATPKMKKFDNVNLIGSYEVDAEGVIPDNELKLIEDGNLKTLINDRIPTPKVRKSNGHRRYKIGTSFQSSVGPGVIDITTSEGKTREELKKLLIETAKDEGLDYAIIVRKIESPGSGIDRGLSQSALMSMIMGGQKEGSLSRPINVYRVSLEDGKEELVRSTELGSLSLGSLKDIMGATKKKFVYNTLQTESGGLSGIFSFAFGFGENEMNLNGIPASYIVPEAVLFQELDVHKEKRPITSKLPIVENPISK
jgi:hypothetical protein